MSIQIGFTNEAYNTQYAPLAVLSAYYQREKLLLPLLEMSSWQKNGHFLRKRS
jgi:hypothetical protein